MANWAKDFRGFLFKFFNFYLLYDVISVAISGLYSIFSFLWISMLFLQQSAALVVSQVLNGSGLPFDGLHSLPQQCAAMDTAVVFISAAQALQTAGLHRHPAQLGGQFFVFHGQSSRVVMYTTIAFFHGSAL